jgi:hypothetical protein
MPIMLRYSGPAGPAYTKHSLRAGVGMMIFSPVCDKVSIKYSTRWFACGTDAFVSASRTNSKIDARRSPFKVGRSV